MKHIKTFAIIAFILIAVLAVTAITVYTTKDNDNQTDVITVADTVTPAENETTTTPADTEDNSVGSKAIAAAIAIGLAGLGGAIGMGLAIAKSAEGISKQPEVKGDIRATLMLGLVFIETVVIYALIVAILAIFVL